MPPTGRPRGRPPRPVPPPPPAVAGHMADLGRLDYLRHVIAQLQAVFDAAMMSRSYTAASAAARQLSALRVDLDAAIREESAPSDSMSDEQLLLLVRQAIHAIPPQYLDAIREALDLREHGAPTT